MISTSFGQLVASLKDSFPKLRFRASADLIRKIWSGEIKRTADFRLIRRYHSAKCKDGLAGFVDDTTWSDLNMDAVFRRMDRCTSAIRSQYLYHRLHKYETDQDRLHARFGEYKTFLTDAGLREKIQKCLLPLNRNGAAYITDLMFSDLPKRPWYFFLFIMSSLLLLASVVAAFYLKVFIFAIMFFGLANLLVHLFYTRKIGGYIPDLSLLSHMLGMVARLSRIDDAPKLSQLQRLRGHCRSAAALNKRIRWLIVDKYRINELAGSVYDYLNHFFLMDLIIFLLSIEKIRAERRTLIDMYENIASLDAAIGIAAWLNSVPFSCKPVFNENNIIDVEDMAHPLIDNPVPNSYSAANSSCLITGSNMAGKTTFIKTVGVNLLLSRTLGVCLAKAANFPVVEVKSSIKRQDDLEDNKSYYYKEIESILEFITLSKNGGKYLFLADEIFRGTNTNERLSSAAAVLNHLCAKNITMVTTHDMELQEFLSEKFEMHHFREQVENEVHFFDYLIKPGPCTSRNAIKLLELKGYPESIVQEAMALSKRLSSLE